MQKYVTLLIVHNGTKSMLIAFSASAFAQSRRDIGIPQENIPSEFKCESTIESNGYVLGDIVEKNCDICWSMPMDKGIEEQSNNGFPKATRLDDKVSLITPFAK